MEEYQQQLEESNAHMEEQHQQLEENNLQLKDQQDEMQEQNRILKVSEDELHKKAEDLENSNRYKSEFLANMSHELRTPLNSIILLSEMLKDDKHKHLDSEEIKKATIINSSGNELLRLIGDILDLSKIEAGKMELIIDKFESSSFAQEIQEQFTHQAQDKNLEFIVIDEYQGEISNDKDRLAQIVRNFISNAMKFTKQGSITFKIQNTQDNKVEYYYVNNNGEFAKAVSDCSQLPPNKMNKHMIAINWSLEKKEIELFLDGELVNTSQIKK